MNRNTKNDPLHLRHVVVPAVPAVPGVPGQVCTRCSERIKPPYYESDLDTTPLCWQCRERPCEGHTAFCHECTCSGSITRSPGMCRCGARWSGERICHCASCHLTFTSINGFDAHLGARRPASGVTTRRCRTEAEMRDRGYEPNSHGNWRIPAPEGIFRRGEDNDSETKGGT